MHPAALNIWDMLLAGLIAFERAVIIPLFGGNVHQPMGLVETLGEGARVMFDLFFATIGTFNLTLVAVAFFLGVVLWIIEAFIKLWLLIKSLIPFL